MAPLTLAQWKAEYEPAIGQIADDALVVADTGKKAAKHPTKKNVQTVLSACRSWLKDARQLPTEVPPIPVAKDEKTWKLFVAASIAASSDCTTALGDGTKSAAKSFQKQLLAVHTEEGRLVAELGGSGQ